MIKDFFLLAINSMKKRKLRSWLTLLGIFIGISAVVSLISLGDGLRTAITGQFSSLSADTLTFSNAETGFGPPGSTAIKKINDRDIKIIESIQGVKIVIPRLIRVAKVEYNNAVIFGYLANIPLEKDKREFVYTNMNVAPQTGRLLQSGDKGKAVLGNDFSKKELFGKSVKVGNKINIQGKDYQVVGILEKASSFTINSVIMMLEDDMREILNIKEDEHDLVVIRVDNPNIIEKVAKEIENEIRKDRKQKKGEEDFRVRTPLQALSAVQTILGIINIIVLGISAISLFIGAIGIGNTMYTSVLERKKDIGTMKAIGAKNSDILILFVIEAGLFGLIGGIAGSLFGVFLSFSVSAIANNYFGQTILSFNLSFPLIFSAIIFSFIIGIISGFIPSYSASKLKPVDALRG